MNRITINLATLAIVAVAAASAQAAPVARDDFNVTTTASLVALCSATETDPMYTAAVNFCHGFAIGTYRVIAIEEAASKAKHKMFCMPPAAPNRDQAIAAFIQWAGNRPKTLASSPTDGIAEYLAAAYPCK